MKHLRMQDLRHAARKIAVQKLPPKEINIGSMFSYACAQKVALGGSAKDSTVNKVGTYDKEV